MWSANLCMIAADESTCETQASFLRTRSEALRRSRSGNEMRYRKLNSACMIRFHSQPLLCIPGLTSSNTNSDRRQNWKLLICTCRYAIAGKRYSSHVLINVQACSLSQPTLGTMQMLHTQDHFHDTFHGIQHPWVERVSDLEDTIQQPNGSRPLLEHLAMWIPWLPPKFIPVPVYQSLQHQSWSLTRVFIVGVSEAAVLVNELHNAHHRYM